MRRRTAVFWLWGLVLLLLWIALKDVSWRDLGEMLEGLQLWQILALLLVNTAIVLLLGARWWLILRAQGHRVPFMAAAGYRLAAFGVSYLTPGPHFGGEPLQALLVGRKHAVPTGQAVASIGLDKLLELCANFAFLAAGVAILVSSGLLGGWPGIYGLAASFGLLLLPLAYLGAIALGAAPLNRLFSAGTDLGPASPWQRAKNLVRDAEKEAGGFLRAHKATFWLAVLLSGIVWAALIFEYSLALRFLGVQLDLWQVISIMTGARIAILLPVPAGLGALEVALVLLSQLVGEQAALGAGISLLIRVRDLAFSLVGLGLGAVWTSAGKNATFDPH